MLIIVTMANSIVINAENVDSNNDLKNIDTVYVDGVEFNFYYDTETGNVIVKGNADESSAEMILESNGDASLSIDNESMEEEEYNLKIHNLDINNVDVDVYDEEYDLVASYDEYDDNVEDTYEGQEAVTWSIALTAALVLTAVYITTYIIYKSNVLYIMASEFYKTVAKAAESVKKAAKKSYYPAYITKKNIVFIRPKKISLNKAASLIKADFDVYSFTSKKAKKAIIKAGYAPYSSEGNKAEFHKIGGKLVFKHWHKGKTNSGGVLRKSGTAHSLFGVPIS